MMFSALWAATVQGLGVIVTIWCGEETLPAWLLGLLVPVAVGLAAGATCAHCLKATATRRTLSLLCLATLLGGLAGQLRLDALLAPTAWDGVETAIVRGVVTEVDVERVLLGAPCIERADDRPVPEADCRGPDRLTVTRQAWDETPLRAGDLIRLEVELRERREPDNPTTLPRMLPNPNRRWGKGLSELSRVTDQSPPWTLVVAQAVRDRIFFDAPSGARAQALYTALLLGDRSDIAPRTRYAYQDTGTAHLLAISGFNLALFGFGFFRLALFLFVRLPWLRHRPAPARYAAWLAVAVTVFYTAIIAPSDATDRALMAIVLTLGGLGLGYEVRASRTVSLCFFVALALDPLALTRAGFQLSFAATISLILAVPASRAVAAVIASSPHLPTPFVRKLAIGLAGLLVCDLFTFLATAPLGLVWFGQFSLHSVWVNLIAIPMMSLLVFPAGLIQLALRFFLPPVAELTDPLVSALGVSFETFILNAGQLIGPQQVPAWPWWLGWSAALLVLLTLSRPRRHALPAAVLLVAATLGLSAHHQSDALEIDVLDIGHGDALLLRHPEAGVMLVDTGGTFHDHASRNLAERTLVPALGALGVAAIDLLVISHAHLDHIGAAPALAERIPIRELWLSPCDWDTAIGRRLREAVEAMGGRARIVAAQPRIYWGSPPERGGSEGDSVALDILWPLPDSLRWDGRCDWGMNDASLVIRLSWAGRSLLLTGDIEHPAEEALLALYPAEALRSDILKVPHHGSKSSSTPAFLDAVRPSIALCSGLPGRAPMPPHDFVLDRYRERGIRLHLTGESGATRLTWRRDGTLRTMERRPAGPPEWLEALKGRDPHALRGAGLSGEAGSGLRPP